MQLSCAALIADEHMEYCIVQRCQVQCKSKRFGSAAFVSIKNANYVAHVCEKNDGNLKEF